MLCYRLVVLLDLLHLGCAYAGTWCGVPWSNSLLFEGKSVASATSIVTTRQIVVGALVEDKYRGVVGDQVEIEDTHSVAIQCWIAAGVYAGFIVISAIRLLHLRYVEKQAAASGNLDSYAQVTYG